MLGTNTHLSRLSDRAHSHHKHGMNILSTSQNSTIIHSIPGILTDPFFKGLEQNAKKIIPYVPEILQNFWAMMVSMVFLF